MKSEEASGAASASDDGSGSKYHPPDLVAAESHVVELPGIEGATIDPPATATEIPKYLIGNAKTPSNLGKIARSRPISRNKSLTFAYLF